MKIFKCIDCGKGYSQKGNLNRHIESVHEGMKLFKCNDCDAAFSQKKETWIMILNQLIKKRSPFNVTFVPQVFR